MIPFFVQIIIGLLFFIVIAIPFSNNIKIINYRYIFLGIFFQIILALILLKVPFITDLFAYLANGVSVLQQATNEGSKFVFGFLGDSQSSSAIIFAFAILPVIIVMSCISAVLWFWGILPLIVNIFSKICQKLFNIGGPIGLGSAANIFVGQVEAPLIIRPYLKNLSKKELLIIMTTGMATVAGSVMVAYVNILEDSFKDVILIQHFLTASILSVPAAIMYSNIMIPSNEITDFENDNVPKIYESTMDAITRGTKDGTNIAVSVGAILITFIALVYIVDSFLGLIPLPNDIELSLQLILGYVFAPIAWLMGIPWNEALISGKLLGIKTALNEFVAYQELSQIESGILSQKSMLITFYGLCGFANFASVGILISGIASMAPERKNDLIDVAFKALVGATLSSCFTGLIIACVI